MATSVLNSDDYYKLDYRIIDEFFPKGMLSILAGRPQIGKSYFASHLAKNLSQHGERVLYFCLEPFTIEMKERLDDSSFPAHVVCIPSISIDEVLCLVNQWRYDAVVIDYVQLMDFVRYIKCFSRDEELKAIWHILDDLAKDKGIRVIGVSQVHIERIDDSEEAIFESCLEYLDRKFLAKRLKAIHRESYYTEGIETDSIQQIDLIDYGIGNPPNAYPIKY